MRLINPGEDPARVVITGIDDSGRSPGPGVRVEIPALASRTLTARELERGDGAGIEGALGDGVGKWRLIVEPNATMTVMSLMLTPTGHLTNLSTGSVSADPDGAHMVPLFPAASDSLGREGFVRVVNLSAVAGDVEIRAFDDSDWDHDPVTLDLGASETVHFNSGDLEQGNAAKGIAAGVGEGRGDWWLQLSTDLDIQVLSYVRTRHDGFLTAMHDVVPRAHTHGVAVFNPGSNPRQESRLRIVNPGTAAARLTITGIDDRGESPGTEVGLSIPAGSSRTTTALELETGGGFDGALGDGRGKWRLQILSDAPIIAMNLLASPTGHLTNLSTAPQTHAPFYPTAFADRVLGMRIVLDEPSEYVHFVSAGRFREIDGTEVTEGTYDYTRTGPNAARLVLEYDNGTICTWTLAFASRTSGDLEFECEDGDGETGSVAWHLAGTNARPIVAAMDDRTITVGNTLDIAVTISDDDPGDGHSIKATSSNEDAATVTVDGASLAIAAVDSGLATITVTATDDSGLDNAESEPVEFTVAAASESGWVRGLFENPTVFKHWCAEPRRGIDPHTGVSYPDVQGTTLDENNWLRSWSDHTYLWYDEIVDTDPDCCDTPTYFGLMKTMETTPSGAEKDRFHLSMDTEEWNELTQSGVSAGYGARFAVLAPRPPRDIRVAYTQPNSPATHPDVAFVRGTKILAVDGVDAVHAPSRADVDVLNAGLFPSEPGEEHRFTVLDPASSVERTVTLRSASITSDPVQQVRVIDTDEGPVGYLLFLDHIATAEKRLADSIVELAEDEIEDLVLDIRYNGGGYTIIANQLAYMIAGASAARGRVFSELRFNDKHTVFNPVTGEVLRPSLFRTTGIGLSLAQGEPLPTLDLDRVFVLTGPGTCSASEAIINGLRGIDVEVILIGETTCGKPHGFYPADNCGTTYFTAQFELVNGRGFGDYAGGFTPDNAPIPDGVHVAGCAVADDFDHAFGDTREARLSAALGYRRDTSCPEPPEGTRNAVLATYSLDGRLLRSRMHGLTIPQDIPAPSG